MRTGCSSRPILLLIVLRISVWIFLSSVFSAKVHRVLGPSSRLPESPCYEDLDLVSVCHALELCSLIYQGFGRNMSGLLPVIISIWFHSCDEV